MAGAGAGGAELFFERLALAFDRSGVEQQICIKPYAPRVARLTEAGLDLHLSAFRPLTKLVVRSRIKRLASHAGANILLTWMNRATAFAPTGPFVHVARLGGYYNLKYYRKCDWLVANTKGIADYLIAAGVPSNKVHHQVNFVPDGAQVAPLLRPVEAEGRITIAALGRLHVNKGFDTLIRALGLCEGVHLLLAGTGPEQKTLIDLVAELNLQDRVSFLGWQDTPQAVIRAADIFVCPSRHEPFGNVIAEAFASKKPVIATASQGAVEHVNTGQTQNGVIVPVDDVAALADAINELAQNRALQAELAAAGYHEWARRFHPDRVTSRWIEFLNEVA